MATSAATTAPLTDSARAALVKRGIRLSYFTIGYNVLEAVIALSAGTAAGSIALVGFGIDSGIEVTSSIASQWRLRRDFDPEVRKRVERITHRIIGASFIALALYVVADSLSTLIGSEAPERSFVGIGLLILSLIVMPALARAKRRVAVAMSSRALKADAMQTSLCAYLSAIALGGVGLNGLFGWWWADPLAALAMVPIIAIEGVEGLRAR